MTLHDTAYVAAPRARPKPTVDDEPFWRAGTDGVLKMQRCGGCGKFQHPPSPVCFRCLSRDLSFVGVSGRGTVYSFTVNHQPWLPELTEPFAVIVVQLEEQDDLRFVSRIVSTPVERVHIGMPVQVVFERLDDDYFAPYFTEAGPNT